MNGLILIVLIGVGKAPADVAVRYSLGQMAPQTYRIPKFVVGSFGLGSIFVTEGSALRDQEVTSPIISGGGGLISSGRGPKTCYLCRWLYSKITSAP
jgi:hypothetical protein